MLLAVQCDGVEVTGRPFQVRVVPNFNFECLVVPGGLLHVALSHRLPLAHCLCLRGYLLCILDLFGGPLQLSRSMTPSMLIDLKGASREECLACWQPR